MNKFAMLYIILLSNMIFASNKIILNQDKIIDFNADNPSELYGTIVIDEINYDILNKNNDFFLNLNIEGAYSSNKIGSPSLPQINNLISIPSGANARVEIINKSQTIIDLNTINSNIKIMPYQGSRPKTITSDFDNSFKINKQDYINDSNTHNLIEVISKGEMRGTNISNLSINPIKYNPVKNELIIYNNIEFIVHFDNINSELDSYNKSKYYSQYFEPIYSKTLINYNQYRSRNNNFIEEKVSYLIIANQVFEGYLDDFINWKTQKGFNVIVVYTDEIGSSASSIKAYINEQYINPANNLPPISFVLLVGDTQQIPPSYSTSEHVSDLDYCDMTNDNIPDILCGRFSAQTPNQLLSQIDKTIMYEKYEMSDPSYLGDVILISGVDSNYAPTYGNGQINYGNDYYFNNNHGINSNTFLYPASGNSGSQILNLASQGAGFINYTAHGYESGWADPSFSVNDVNNMSNYEKYGTMMGNTCLTNAFDSGECFGEALLRKDNAGAIGYIGGSDYTYWDEDFWFGVGSGSVSSSPNYNSTGEGAYDGMFHENNENNWAIVNHAIIMLGNLAVVQANGMDDYYWEIYHLMGDPSVSTYLKVPEINDVDHPVFLSPGANQITINAEPFSYVGLSMGNQLIGSGIINEFGIGNIDLINTSNPGEILLTVTGQNLQPYFSNIILSAPDGPYVAMNNVIIDLGNDDLISIGENIIFNLYLENLGTEPANNIIMQLNETSLSPYVLILNSNQELSILNEGDIENITFEINVDSMAPNGHSFNINLLLNANDNEYSYDYPLNIEFLIENFESGDFLFLPWSFSGNSNWEIDYTPILNETDYVSAKSGSISENMTSDLILEMYVEEDGIISFDKKVSCENVGNWSGNYYDYLAFYIDGIEQGKWAGEIDWSENTFPVNQGNHTFLWRYNKDGGVNEGEDSAWIDNITFPPAFINSFVLGDINNDSNINVSDVVVAVNLVLNSEYNYFADLNSNGVVNVSDIVLLVSIILEN